MIGYSCKYAPVEILDGFGLTYEEAAPHNGGCEYAEGMLYPSLCGYAKAVAEGVAQGTWDGLLCTDCCDAMKRAHDALVRDGHWSRIIGLPRNTDAPAIGQFARNLARLIASLEDALGIPFDVAAFLSALPKKACMLVEDHFILLGARAPSALLRACAEATTLPVRDLTCAGQGRGFDNPPAAMALDELMVWYAEQLLGQMPCMRMADVEARRKLWEHPACQGLIYHTLKFCDYYGFEWMRLDTEKPVLRLETDYMDIVSGQLSTRLEAFFEANGQGQKKERTMSGNGGGSYTIGIDIGSTSTDVVVLDQERRIAAQIIVPTGAKSGEAGQAALDQLIARVGITHEEIRCVVSTGYGRKTIAATTQDVTEITCHARGAYALSPGIRTIIDIGGQDSKVIRLDNSGGVMDFAMNDKCAAGTGRFLELMARSLEEDLESFAQMGLEWKADVQISSMCAVFSEREVVSLMAQNKEKADIIHGINQSIARRIKGMCVRLKAEGPYMMTGGVAQNRGVVAALEEALGEPLRVSGQAQLAGAYGAALLAWEQHMP